jgi:hypothetical protein
MRKKSVYVTNWGLKLDSNYLSYKDGWDLYSSAVTIYSKLI